MSQEPQAVVNPLSHLEEEVLDFWDKAKIFEKSVEKDAPKGSYVFYDGPPFGTGEPHYGHILSSVSKDVVPRFWTMNGFKVERKWGWDCHGLPIENIIETDMKISGKKQIEEMGIDIFNEACRSRVLEYADLWDVMIRRIGRWVDFKNSYKTMDLNFMESVWWGFKEMWQKDLVYEGRKVLLYCPRCETPISNFEVAMDNSYKDVTDDTLYVKFRATNASEKLGIDGIVNILAWTTTPWTLPSSVALAVGEKIDYVVVEILELKSVEVKGIENIMEKPTTNFSGSINIILAKERVESVLTDMPYKLIKELKGVDLLGLEYEALYKVNASEEVDKKGYYVVAGDFVTTDDGAGIVHIAPVYGEDDYKVGLKHELPILQTLDEKGHFTDAVTQFAGMYFKKANEAVIVDLEERQVVFKKEKVTHSYPHCHRCSTALFYNAIPAWFINIGKIRERMLELNKNINWYPEHLKDGRFAKGIETAPDWNISRNRYFATPMPIWRCDECGDIEVVGSVAELKEKSGATDVTDIHNHRIDHLTWKCDKCSGTRKRIKEVFDCWVESGSMPFAQMHFPFENEQKFKDNYPAQFISEYISQTRAWFYVTHVLSTALFDQNSFENVATTGVILNDKGEKMSKSKKNYPDPYKIINAYGADALRAYLMGSSVMHADNLFFNEDEVKELFRKNNMILWNVFKFYEQYAGEAGIESGKSKVESQNVLDQWIMAKLDELITEVTKQMHAYDLPRSVRPISDFINDLSTWYLRRSRDRFKSDNQSDKESALATTKHVLIELAKVMAPFMPFISENLWQKVTGLNFSDENMSVHLEAWPELESQVTSHESRVVDQMEVVRKIVEGGLAQRDEKGIKIRQPLPYYSTDVVKELASEFTEIIKDELNVLEIKFGANELGTEMTEELLNEGMKRELVRTINNLRKNAGLTIEDRVVIYWSLNNGRAAQVLVSLGDELMRDTLALEIKNESGEMLTEKIVKVNGEEISLGLRKV